MRELIRQSLTALGVALIATRCLAFEPQRERVLDAVRQADLIVEADWSPPIPHRAESTESVFAQCSDCGRSFDLPNVGTCLENVDVIASRVAVPPRLVAGGGNRRPGNWHDPPKVRGWRAIFFLQTDEECPTAWHLLGVESLPGVEVPDAATGAAWRARIGDLVANGPWGSLDDDALLEWITRCAEAKPTRVEAARLLTWVECPWEERASFASLVAALRPEQRERIISALVHEPDVTDEGSIALMRLFVSEGFGAPRVLGRVEAQLRALPEATTGETTVDLVQLLNLTSGRWLNERDLPGIFGAELCDDPTLWFGRQWDHVPRPDHDCLQQGVLRWLAERREVPRSLPARP